MKLYLNYEVWIKHLEKNLDYTLKIVISFYEKTFSYFQKK